MRITKLSRKSFLNLITLFFVGSSILLTGCPKNSKDLVTYLTWSQEDTSHSITVHFQQPGKAFENPKLYFSEESKNNDIGAYEAEQDFIERNIEGTDRLIYSVELENLEAGQDYFYIIVEGDKVISKERKFKTLPSDGSSIRLITGGDTGTSDDFTDLLEVAAKQSPHVAMFGGDLAYANGTLGNINLWDRWLNAYASTMITPDGYTIPMILALGNHETASGSTPKEKAPFFFGNFAQDPNPYFYRKLGSHAGIFILDSGHTVSHGGTQRDWLEFQMRHKAEETNHLFALYHVPLYPTHRKFGGSLSKAGRKEWLPIFDRYGLRAGFENHDHTMKRTKRLLGGEVSETDEGTIYFGDGCFGRDARPNRTPWYVETSKSVQHFWVVDVEESQTKYQALGRKGKIYDTFTDTSN